MTKASYISTSFAILLGIFFDAEFARAGESSSERQVVKIELSQLSPEILIYRINLLLGDSLNGESSKRAEMLMLVKEVENRIEAFPESDKKINKEVLFEGTNLASVRIDRASVINLLKLIKN